MGDDTDDVTFKAIGIMEREFCREFKIGRHSRTVDEFHDLFLEDKINPRELKIIIWIDKRTIRWRDTHVRSSRTSIGIATKIKKQNLHLAIKSLVKKDLIIERRIGLDDYYYALNPKRFGGLIVVDSYETSYAKINKKKKKLLKVPRKSAGIIMKNPVIDLITGSNQINYSESLKRLPETAQHIDNKDELGLFSNLFNTYLTIHGVSRGSIDTILIILHKKGKAISLLPKLISLFCDHSSDIKYIAEELLLVDKTGTDSCSNRMFQYGNAIHHMHKFWPSMKSNWSSAPSCAPRDTELKENAKLIKSLLIIFLTEYGKEHIAPVLEMKRK